MRAIEAKHRLDDIQPAQATGSFAFVVTLLPYSPSWRELPGQAVRMMRAKVSRPSPVRGAK